MDVEREMRWASVASRLGPIETAILVALPVLGRRDARLIADDEGLREAGADPIDLNDHLLDSYLWVLGTYEIVRVLAERSPENRRLRELRDRFTRLRIPLAKHEPAKKHKETDWPIAWPATSPEHGVAWRIGPDTYISRRELANELIGFLEAVARGEEKLTPAGG